MSIESNEEFRPKIVAFCCNWCSYAGADLAGSSRLSYPADVKIIRVPCSCRVNPMFILRAFEKGADGVILCGCHPGDCHYTTGNYYARRRMTLLFSMLDFIGVENGRTRVEWVSAAEGVKFSQTMNEFVVMPAIRCARPAWSCPARSSCFRRISGATGICSLLWARARCSPRLLPARRRCRRSAPSAGRTRGSPI